MGIQGFTDIHSHVVYGVDDGPESLEEMERMLDAAHAQGITAIVSTPHRIPALRPFDSEAYASHLEEARAYCKRCGYDMELYAGAEILYTPAMEPELTEHRLAALAGSDCVLVEFSPRISFGDMERAVQQLVQAGYTPVLAHVERYDALLHGKNAWKLKAHVRVRYQLNASSLLRSRGLLKDWRIRSWIRDELIDFVASDAHDCKRRPFQMKQAFEALRRCKPEAYAQKVVTAKALWE